MSYFLPKLGKILQKLSSAAVVIGAIRVKVKIIDLHNSFTSN